MSKHTESTNSRAFKLDIDYDLPNILANYNEVNFNKTRPPMIFPAVWQPACIVLIYFELLNYFKQSPSSAISCKHNPKYIKKQRIANIVAWSKSVTNESTIKENNVNVWLNTTHVFLLPYDTFEYFYKIGAVMNFNEKGKLESEKRLSVK